MGCASSTEIERLSEVQPTASRSAGAVLLGPHPRKLQALSELYDACLRTLIRQLQQRQLVGLPYYSEFFASLATSLGPTAPASATPTEKPAADPSAKANPLEAPSSSRRLSSSPSPTRRRLLPPTRSRNDVVAAGTDVVVRHLEALDEAKGERGFFFRHVLGRMVSSAANFYAILDGTDLRIDMPEVRLTRVQCFTILSAALFGLLPCQVHVTAQRPPLANVDYLLRSTEPEDEQLLVSLLHYFCQVAHTIKICDDNNDAAHAPLHMDEVPQVEGDDPLLLHIQRITETKFHDSLKASRRASTTDSKPLGAEHSALPLRLPVIRQSTRESGNANSTAARQLHVGPCLVSCSSVIGKTLDGGPMNFTDDERDFITAFPEILVARLFHSNLSAREVLYFRNLWPSSAPSIRIFSPSALVLADPIDLSLVHPSVQRLKSNVLRDLQKLLNAVCALQPAPKVSSGLWGYRPDTGEAGLRFVLLWIAASVCRVDLHYFPPSGAAEALLSGPSAVNISASVRPASSFSAEEFSSLTLPQKVLALDYDGLTCGTLLQCTLSCSFTPEEDFWIALHRQLTLVKRPPRSN